MPSNQATDTFQPPSVLVPGAPRVRAEEGAAASAGSALARPGWVLVIDDDDQVRRILRAMLELGGYGVLDAASLELALATYGQHDVRVLIYDLILPDQELTLGLRQARAGFLGASMLAISGGGRCGSQPLLEVARELGAAATLVKPISKASLLAAVASLWAA